LEPATSCAKDLAWTIAERTLKITGKATPKEADHPQGKHLSEASFPNLGKARVALWPLVYLDLDLDVAESAYKVFGTRDQLLENISDRIQSAFGPRLEGQFLGPKALAAAFPGPEQRTFLDPRAFLPWDGKNASREPSLATLAAHPGLQGITYLVIPRLLRMVRTFTQSPGIMVGPGGIGVGVGSSASTRSSLQLAVVELSTGKILWDGAFTGQASSAYMRETAVKENLDELMTQLSDRARKAGE
ncbi:MAG: hypothetical protein WAT51_07135, partial [Holophaga sp.]